MPQRLLLARATLRQVALPGLALGLGLLLAAPRTPAATSDRPEDYRAGAAIRLPADGAGEGLLRLRLPLAVLQQSRRADRADLRVFNARGEPVPMAWAGDPLPVPGRWSGLPLFTWPAAPPSGRSAGSEKIEVQAGSASVRVERRGGAEAPPRDADRSRWLLDLQALRDESPRTLRLHWAGDAALVRRLRIEASADASRWQAVGEATLLATGPDEAGTATAPAFAPLRQDTASLQPLPPDTRYLRLVLDQPLALTRVEAELQGRLPEGTPPGALERTRLQARPGDEAGVWQFDPGAELALRELQLHLPQLNSVLPLRLAQRRPEPPFTSRRNEARFPARQGAASRGWMDVGGHTAYRLVRGGTELESPPWRLQAPPAREWQLRRTGPDTGFDAAALELTIGWLPPELLFAARGPGPFTLAVGREHGAFPAALERERLIPGYRRGDEFRLPAATLDPPVAREATEPTLRQRLQAASPEDRRRWLLWAVLAGAVAGLGALAWRLWRELSAPRREQG